MYHVAAYTEAIDNAANNDIAALTDDYLVIQNAHFLLTQDWLLHWAWVGSATLNRARLSQPTINVVTRPFIRPLDRAAVPPDLPAIADYRENPFRLRAREELVIEATSGIAMGTERFTALIGIMDRLIPAPVGEVYTLRGTSTTAAVANSWTSLTMTWDNQLPEGQYAVVGLETQSANAQASRLIIEGLPNRPGSVSVTGLGNETHRMFRKGGLGRWGDFPNYIIPTPQVLANAADASHEVYLDIVKLGGRG